MRHILTALAALCLFGCVVAFPATAHASSTPSCVIDDSGNCSYYDPVPAYDDLTSGDDGEWLAYSASGINYHCRVVHAIRTVRNVYWVTLLQYVEQVRWCYDGAAVREFTRWRWPQSMTFGMWSFDQNVANSCLSEYCQEQIGGYFQHASTTGQFSPNYCPLNFCGSRHPKVNIVVNADGGWQAFTDG